MINSFSAIGSAVYGRMGTVQYTYDNGGTALVTSALGLYEPLAPQGTNPPYNIFQLLDSGDEYTMGNSGGEDIRLMFKNISDRLFPSQQAYAIYEQAHALLHNAPLSVNAATLLRCQRVGRFSFRDAEGYWNTGGVYRIELWET